MSDHTCHFRTMTITPMHYIDQEHKRWMEEGICGVCGTRRVTLYEAHDTTGRCDWVTTSTVFWYSASHGCRVMEPDMSGVEVYSERGDMDLAGNMTADQ